MMTLNIPDDIERQLKIVAQNNHVTPAELVLSLLRKAVNQTEIDSKPVSCFDLMQADLGCIDEAPADLSINKRYLDSYGQ